MGAGTTGGAKTVGMEGTAEGGVRALDEVSLTIGPGEVVALVGHTALTAEGGGVTEAAIKPPTSVCQQGTLKFEAFDYAG